MSDKQSVSASTTIAASPDSVYALVSDLPRMGEWSPEATGGEWVGGASGPAPGARFKGSNAQGKKKWKTTVTVTDASPSSRFAFINKVGPKTVAEWTYEIAPSGAGCTVTETWTDGRGPVIGAIGKVLTGVDDRVAHTRSMIETTLAKIKQAAESGA
ncbi:MAG TPA: SRPBCC family protein [Pseudonocardia sp.]|jgi:hypothetical protein